MRAAATSLNVLIATAYLFIGFLTIADVRRTREYSHFALGFIALAFTCGPHHLVHTVHTAFEGRPATLVDVVVVALGVPPGLAWLLLRVEAFRGGRGERFVSGSPRWLTLVPALLVLDVGTAAFGAVATGSPRALDAGVLPEALPNVLLIGIYAAIAAQLLRTQITKRPSEGGWSGSGLLLSGLFSTCAMMHLVFFWLLATGTYALDIHGFVTDVVSVPAGLYFLWVVRVLHREIFADWRREMAGQIREGLATASITP